MEDFPRIKRLPPYVFNVINDLKALARHNGEDIIDFGMGNPDQPTPKHIVEKLIETAARPDTHRYSMSRGIPRLRKAISDWYKKRYDVDICPAKEAIVTMGSKEGLAHLALATCAAGDTIIVPTPAYPIHPFGFVIADAQILQIPLTTPAGFLSALEETLKNAAKKPKILLINFPANPTTDCVDLAFFEKIIEIARQHHLWVVHDLAYADLVFDGYKAPSILQVPGAKEVAVECFTLSKSYNMPGWRVGFFCGNPELVNALTRMKSYLDYGLFTPIQVAAITALEGPQECVAEICELYQKRRDVLCDGLNDLGWPVEKPKATMFVWARIPEAYRAMGSLEFTKYLLQEAKVAVSPGIGFGEHGDEYVRFGLIENHQRTRQALKCIRNLFQREETCDEMRATH